MQEHISNNSTPEHPQAQKFLGIEANNTNLCRIISAGAFLLTGVDTIRHESSFPRPIEGLVAFSFLGAAVFSNYRRKNPFFNPED